MTLSQGQHLERLLARPSHVLDLVQGRRLARAVGTARAVHENGALGRSIQGEEIRDLFGTRQAARAQVDVVERNASLLRDACLVSVPVVVCAVAAQADDRAHAERIEGLVECSSR